MKRFITLLLVVIFLKGCVFDMQPLSESQKKAKPQSQNPSPNPHLNIQDALYKDQYYLKKLNYESLWKQGYTGKNMHIAIFDTPASLEESTQHPDLKQNHNITLSYNYIPFEPINHSHATNVAGIIAATGNTIGIRGIAYESTFYTFGILTGQTQNIFDRATDAFKRLRKIPEISVINNSWGVSTRLSKHKGYWDALEEGLENGFYGKGIVYVKSAGNNGKFADATMEPENNFYGNILVNSLDKAGKNTNENWVVGQGLPIGFITSEGSNLWVSAYGTKIFTTALDGKYQNFNATSSAAPQVSGVVALMRQANPNLTWRDVKMILAETSTKNDPTHNSWQKGFLKKSETKHFYYNRRYGFGMVNPEKAIALAKKWQNLPPMKTFVCRSQKPMIDVKNSNIHFIESVIVKLELSKKTNINETKTFLMELQKFQKRKNMKSTLYKKGKHFSFAGDHAAFLADNLVLEFLSSAFLGGAANGIWTLKMEDTQAFTQLKKWELIIRGH